MSALGEQFIKIKTFLLHDLWIIDADRQSWFHSLLLRQVRVVAAMVKGFLADQCMLRASALTYTTLLSIVPLLALMFALLKGFGVQNTLEPLILEHLALGAEDIVSQIIRYIDNTNVARLGVVGLAALFFAVLTLLSNIEKSFNHIWGVNETRPLLRRFADYFSVVTICPIFVIAAISMTSSLANNQLVAHLQTDTYFGPLILLLFKAIPFVGMWITFTALYIFMPNTRVSYTAALVGGILGGTLWQLAQWGYVHFQVGVGRYNAIYGTMAALPIFMVWMYVSWLIVLLGVEMTYAWQNLRLIPSDIRGSEVNFASRELVSLTAMLAVSEPFYRGESRWDSSQVAARLDLPPRLAHDILQQLVRLGFLSEVKDGLHDRDAYQPGRALDALTVHDLLQGLKQDGINYSRLRNTPERELVREIEETITTAGRRALAEMSLQDLVKKMLVKREAQRDQALSGEKVSSEKAPFSKTA
jgi:membrane protein